MERSFRSASLGASLMIIAMALPMPPAAASSSTLDMPIGVLVSLQGDLGDDGYKMRDGAIMRAEEINAKGPLTVGGQQYTIRLITEDDASLPGTAVQAANKLVATDKVQVIIGSDGSALCGAIDSTLSQYKVPAISPSCTAAELAAKEWFFRSVGSDALQAEAMFDLVERLREHRWFGKKVALLSVNNAYGKGIHESMKTLLAAGGYQIASETLFEEGKPSYEGEVRAIKAAKSRDAPAENLAVLFTAYPKHALPIMRDVHKLDVLPSNGYVWVSNDGIVNSDTLVDDATAQAALQGLFGTNPTAPPTSNVYKEFKEAFRLKFGYLPSSYAAFAYDALGMAVQAVKAADAWDGAKIKAALETMSGAAKYSGVTGDKEIDAGGDIKTQFYDIYRVTGRDWRSSGAFWIDPAKGVENFTIDPQAGELPDYGPPPPPTPAPSIGAAEAGIAVAAVIAIVVVIVVLMWRRKPGAARPAAQAPSVPPPSASAHAPSPPAEPAPPPPASPPTQ
jgi:branched-chain amino acid transport system substrate-binding protein